MADYTERISEIMYPLVYKNADSFSAATYTTDYASLAGYHRAWCYINVGDMQENATLDVALYQATDTSGTSAKAITSKSITQLTQASGDGDDLLCIELQTEELDVDNGFDCVAVRVVVGTAAVELGLTLFGCMPRYAPTATANWAEIVT